MVIYSKIELSDIKNTLYMCNTSFTKYIEESLVKIPEEALALKLKRCNSAPPVQCIPKKINASYWEEEDDSIDLPVLSDMSENYFSSFDYFKLYYKLDKDVQKQIPPPQYKCIAQKNLKVKDDCISSNQKNLKKVEVIASSSSLSSSSKSAPSPPSFSKADPNVSYHGYDYMQHSFLNQDVAQVYRTDQSYNNSIQQYPHVKTIQSPYDQSLSYVSPEYIFQPTQDVIHGQGLGRQPMYCQPPQQPCGFEQAESNRPRRISSQYLIEFKINNRNKPKLKELIGQEMLLDVIKFSDGSRFVQNELGKATAEEKKLVFEKIGPELINLCTDPFANYVIQKLFDVGNPEHKPLITRKLLSHILPLSTQMYGCRVVQKAIEFASQATLIMILKGLSENNGVLGCIYDQHGNHVIQKFIEKAEPYVIQILMQTFEHQIIPLSKNMYGCRIVQRLLNHCNNKQNILIMMQILSGLEELCKDDFGNYVVQHIIINGDKHHHDNRNRKSIIQRISNKILDFSINKFGSNVVEKCFSHGDKSDRKVFFEKIVGVGQNVTRPPFLDMMEDGYGNYVIQKMIEFIDCDQKKSLKNHIQMWRVNRDTSPFTKYIFIRLDNLFPLPN